METILRFRSEYQMSESYRRSESKYSWICVGRDRTANNRSMLASILAEILSTGSTTDICKFHGNPTPSLISLSIQNGRNKFKKQ